MQRENDAHGKTQVAAAGVCGELIKKKVFGFFHLGTH